MGQRGRKHGAAMKERPIIMGAESVTAIIKDYKTHTRRVIKPQPPVGGSIYWDVIRDGHAISWKYLDENGETLGPLRCPYGQVGDRLWVKEKIRCVGHDSVGEFVWLYEDGTTKGQQVVHEYQDSRWRSPLFMPRALSRLTLEIVSINAERLQDITNEGAAAEGIVFGCDSRDHFADYWDTINAARGYPWASNPWVWDIGFKKVEG